MWPTTARFDNGRLVIGGLDVVTLAARFGTPLYVIDEDDFRARCRRWRAAFADADVYYAGKAFLCVEVARWLASEGLSLDVCTGGELAVAERAGFPGERLLFHGNNKSVAELRRAVGYGVGRIVLDSFTEIERLARVAAEAGVRQPVLVRVTPGVEASAHDYVATGVEDQKFGFSLAAGAAATAIRKVLATSALELRGLHVHIGSQIFGTDGFVLAARRMVGLLAAVRAERGVELAELDLGGGMGIAYTSREAPLSPAEVAAALRGAVAQECAAAGLPEPRIAVEPGRAISGPAGVAVYEVGTVKELPGLRTYVSVDGGISDNVRAALYGARYTVVLASRRSSAPSRSVTVCGKHCEAGDILARDVELPADLCPGDLVAVPASGAYHRSMANNYNQVPRPPVVAVAAGAARVLLRRETEGDLLRLDAG
ncbi:MAG: diaminopimelate decarboxylase [Mycobacteriales bacterium]